MVVDQFIRWCETAGVEARRRGLLILAQAWAEGALAPSERVAAEEAFLLFLDDPSDRVRRVLAEIVAPHADAPLGVLLGLCEDIEPIALLTASTAPALSERQLCHVVDVRPPSVQAAIAGRPFLPGVVVRHIAEHASREACLALLANQSTRPAPESLALMAERFPSDGTVRAALLESPRLPAAARQSLVEAHAAALSDCGFVRGLLGSARARDIVRGAADKAAVAIGREAASAGQSADFVEHMRASGQLTEAFLFRSLFDGNVDLFAAALAALSGYSDKRVRAVLVEARERPLGSLLAAAGLDRSGVPVVRSALVAWREAAQEGRRGTRAGVVTEALRVAASAAPKPALRDLVALLGRLAAETVRDEARPARRRAAAA
ncbi:DUF2336 domain-containing protein [Antarcticirhabdus aurantiaca]|uniref:DUF2336 domain-containing protein n=1 Tax=Antarcticirhabdus aurantiaca TaxID=2606717 RepID=A0ACD4NVH5_9HYPH|nr:DUF2336 domain-containing protein [Antarcticirhabdus aurantiaca]WAJ30768.1 DUF2336 domain-containing protein [Jeongeuplla avenae]